MLGLASQTPSPLIANSSLSHFPAILWQLCIAQGLGFFPGALPDTSLVLVALPKQHRLNISAFTELVLAAIKLEFDILEASAVFPEEGW